MALKKNVMAALSVAFAAFTLVGCDWNTDTPVIGKLVGLTDAQAFKVGSSICTTDEVKIVLMDLQNQYKKDFGGQVDWNIKMGNTTLEQFLLNKVETELSVIYAMSSLADEKQLTLTEEENSRIHEAAKTYYSALNDAEKKYSNATQETIESIYKNYYLADKIYAVQTEGISESISDEDARVMQMQYIFIDTTKTPAADATKTLKEIKKQVESGKQDFLVQARKNSDNTNVSVNLRKNEATAEYQTKAFALNEGQMSDIITQDDGVYLVMCVKSYLEKETEENKQRMILENKINVFGKIYDSFVGENATDRNSSVWENMTFSNDENIAAANLFEVYDTIRAE